MRGNLPYVRKYLTWGEAARVLRNVINPQEPCQTGRLIALACTLVSCASCSPPLLPPTHPAIVTVWVIGVNASYSVSSAKDDRPSVVFAVALGTSLDPETNKVEIVKVYRRVEVAVPVAPAPRGRNHTFGAWMRQLEPIPVPSSVKGTRSDLFFQRVAKKAKEYGPGVRVIGVLVGDGYGEHSNPTTFRAADRALAAAPNAYAAYVGARPGATDEIERDLPTLRAARRLAVLGNVRELSDNIDRLKTLEAWR